MTHPGMVHENRTARLTLLIDPEKKAVFEELCLREDLTPSQVVRRLIRSYIEEKLGRPWQPSHPSPASRVQAPKKTGRPRSHRSR